MRAWIASLTAIAAGVGLIVMAATVGTAQAAQVTMVVTATGNEENPPVPGGVTAPARFVFDDVAKTLTYAVTISGLSPDLVTASHIHRGAVGVNGPVIINLSLVGFTQISGTLNLSDADIADLRAGNLYVNVHSKQFPGGVARAQLNLPAAAAAPAAAALPRAGGGLAQPPNYLLAAAGALFIALGGFGALVLARRRA